MSDKFKMPAFWYSRAILHRTQKSLTAQGLRGDGGKKIVGVDVAFAFTHRFSRLRRNV